MKKFLLVIVILVAVAVGIYLYLDATTKKPSEKVAAIVNTNNTPAFNASYDQMLNSYYSLKNALVAADTSKANAAAGELVEAARAVKLNEIEDDTTGLIGANAKSFTESIAGSAATLREAGGLEEKRQAFETITDPLWNLTRTVRYDKEQVYYQYCPMAFDDRGAYWLSRENTVLNPYFGDKMLRCGSVEDSLRIQ